jgi:hypothetical protein
LRPALKTQGITVGLSETSEVLGNPTGGSRCGAIYEGLTDAALQWDLRTTYARPGVIFARAFQIHGRGLSGNNLGNVMTASSIEALPSTRLFELWYEHYALDGVRLKIGQQAADQEFLVSTTSKLFVNATFGFPTLAAADLPSGGPAYPLGTPAVRLRLDPSDKLVLLAAAFNGDPAGPGAGSPQARNASGTAFRAALILIDQLKEIYIDGQLETIDTTQWYPRIMRKDYTVGLNVSESAVDDPDQQFYENYVCAAERNYTGYCSTEVDKLVLDQIASRDGYAILLRRFSSPKFLLLRA